MATVGGDCEYGTTLRGNDPHQMVNNPLFTSLYGDTGETSFTISTPGPFFVEVLTIGAACPWMVTLTSSP